VTPVAKATSASNPSAAPTPVKASARVPAKKAAPTAAEGVPTGEGPAAKGKGKGKAGDAEKAPKAPRAKNAYMFFMADKRDAVKGEHPHHFALFYLLQQVCQLHSMTKVCRLQSGC
jgi:hypothetical protein